MTEVANPNGAQVAVRAEPAAVVALDPTAFGLPADFMEQMRFAEFVATSDLVPKQLQGKPANVFLIVQKALALGLPWDVAMSGIHIIEGKVTAGAKLLRMLLRRAGHVFFPHTVTDKEVRATLTLAFRPNDPIEVTYTVAEAQAAGLTSKAVWKNYVKSMLVAAATRRAVDWYCAEVAMGLDLTDETLAAAFGETATTTAAPGPRPAPDDKGYIDGEVEPPAEGEDTAQVDAASHVMSKARDASDVTTLTKLGKEARTQGLLESVVQVEGGEPTTLKDFLMTRMREVESGQGATH